MCIASVSQFREFEIGGMVARKEIVDIHIEAGTLDFGKMAQHRKSRNISIWIQQIQKVEMITGSACLSSLRLFNVFMKPSNSLSMV